MITEPALQRKNPLTGKRITPALLGFILLALIFTTQLRASLLVIYPVIVVGFIASYHFKLSKSFYNMASLLVLGLLISWRLGFFLKYNLVSLYYVLPFLALLFCAPVNRPAKSTDFTVFVAVLTFFTLVNNVFGFAQYFLNPDDDSFKGLYGKFTVTQNGLALLNSVLFFYYFQLFLLGRKTWHLVLAGVFILCSVMGFYGAGMVVLFAAIGLFYLKLSVKSAFRLVFISLMVGVVVLFLIKTISPNTYEYNENIAAKFLTVSGPRAPRKIKIARSYVTEYAMDPASLFFGSGPGTFNSRSAFMVGSPSYFPDYPIKSAVQPYYFGNFAYTLWNPSNVTRYDGFVNQPFSTVIALLGEYGLLFTALLFYSLYRMYRQVKRFDQSGTKTKDQEMQMASRMSRFLLLMLFLLLLIDNYIEYPEVVALLVILIKLAGLQTIDKRLAA